MTTTYYQGRTMAQKDELARLRSQTIKAIHDATNSLTLVCGNIGLAKMYLNESTEQCVKKLVEAEEAVMLVKNTLSKLSHLAQASGMDITEPPGNYIPDPRPSP